MPVPVHVELGIRRVPDTHTRTRITSLEAGAGGWSRRMRRQVLDEKGGGAWCSRDNQRWRRRRVGDNEEEVEHPTTREPIAW
jgi:hypothetical protein